MSVAICRAPDGVEPCPYCANCGGLRQIVQSQALKRGPACEFYVGFAAQGDDSEAA